MAALTSRFIDYFSLNVQEICVIKRIFNATANYLQS